MLLNILARLIDQYDVVMSTEKDHVGVLYGTKGGGIQL